MRRGEIWWATLPEPWGRRPVLLIARDEAYEVLNWLAIAPLTTRIRQMPTAVQLDPRFDGVPAPCIVNLDAIQMIHSQRLDSVVTRLRPEKMEAVDRAIHFALGLRH
jgi:mRNA interferase MazF